MNANKNDRYSGELLEALARQKEERKQKALELRIPEKALEITQILGREYFLSNHSMPGSDAFLAYELYEKGGLYQDRLLRINTGVLQREASEKGKELEFIRISLVKRGKGILGFLLNSYDDVFFQKREEGEETEVNIFEKEYAWVRYFDSLHEVACKKADFEKAREGLKRMNVS